MTKLKAVDSRKQLDAELCGDFTVNEKTGEAYISQRKAAELCGVYQNSVVHFFKEKGDISQGLNIDQLDSVVQHYCTKGKQEAIQFMMKCAKAGYKAYIYHEAGYKMDASPKTPQTFIEAMELATTALKEAEAARAVAEEKRIQLDQSRQWYTIKRVAFANGLNWKELSWRKLKAAGDTPRKKVFDANFPAGVNAYHISAWLVVYPELELPDSDYDENTALCLTVVR